MMSLSIYHDIDKLLLDVDSLKNDMAQLKDTSVSKEHLQHIIQHNLEGVAPETELNGSSMLRKHSSLKNSFIGVTVDVLNNSELETDFFSVMMLNKLLSRTWLIGLISFMIQMTLGFLVIAEQVDTTSFGTFISIPFQFRPSHCIAQSIVILLAVMTQTDLLVGTRTILLLPMKDSRRWMNVIGESGQPSNALWMRRVFLPNFLKIVQGALILVATFFIIVQSEKTVELLKDYCALFVISSIDNLFFNVAAMGYFGMKLSTQAVKAKSTRIEESNVEIKSTQFFVMGTMMTSLFGFFLYVTIGQANGRYFHQTYPLCPLDNVYFIESPIGPISFQSVVGDGVCQFANGMGTNRLECGWDGGDCLEINERYPDCKNVHTSRLGDGICDGGFYMWQSCGYDNGDCIAFRDKIEKYPFCQAEEPNRWGDGKCDSGLLNSASCGFDDGDCTENNTVFFEKYPNCSVSNKGFLPDGVCSSHEAYSLECGFDGGACGDCNIDDLDLVNSGFCDPPKIQLVGEEFEGDLNWYSFVLGNDGNLYGIPFNAKKVLKFNPITKSTTLVGKSVDGMWAQGLLGKDGCIYGVPFNANSILKYDPITEITTLIAENDPLISGELAFNGGILNDDGIIYFIPFRSKKVVKFDPFNPGNPLVEIGEDLGDELNKYGTGVIGSDGNIYCIPYEAKKVLKITLSDDTTSFIGEDYLGEDQWTEGILAPDENIYAVPLHGNRILQINTKNQTTSLIGPDLGSDWKWTGFVEGLDGYFYGIPFNSLSLLRFDPVNKTVVTIPLDDDALDVGIWTKWVLGARANNGNIYAVPFSQKRILEISFEFD